MWRNWLGGARDIYAALSSEGGKTFAAAQKLGSGTWMLNACPMGGGGVAFNRAGQMLTTWRREKTVFACESARSEQHLADSALNPNVTGGKGGDYYLWEGAGALMLKKGAAKAVRLAAKAKFAAAAPLPNRGPVIVWESAATSTSTLLAEVVD